jgi:hypothetical protein
VLRVSLTRRRAFEHLANRIFYGVGSTEPLIPLTGVEAAQARVSMQWRKPLSIEEINRMAPTRDVRLRQGRP